MQFLQNNFFNLNILFSCAVLILSPFSATASEADQCAIELRSLENLQHKADEKGDSVSLSELKDQLNIITSKKCWDYDLPPVSVPPLTVKVRV